MTFYINDDEYNFNTSELDDIYLSEGKEGTVYKYKDDAIKIYHKYSNKERLDEKTCKYLSSFDTNRILLPRKLIYDKDRKFIGYTTNYHQKYNLENLKRMKIKDLKSELELIKKDLLLLSSKNISIDDLFIDNIILSDGLYFIDPGSFWINKNNRYLKSSNFENMNNFLIDYILSRAGNISKKKTNILKNRLYYDEFVSESLPNSKETSHSYIRKLVS